MLNFLFCVLFSSAQETKDSIEIINSTFIRFGFGPDYLTEYSNYPSQNKSYNGQNSPYGKIGFTGGIEINQFLGKHFSIGTGIYYLDLRSHQYGSYYTQYLNNPFPYHNGYYTNFEYDRKDQYFYFPLNLMYTLRFNGWGFYIGVSPFLNYDLSTVINSSVPNSVYYYFPNLSESGLILKIGWNFQITKNIDAYFEYGTAFSDANFNYGNIGVSYLFGRKEIKQHPKSNYDWKIDVFGGIGIGGTYGFGAIVPQNEYYINTINGSITMDYWPSKVKEYPSYDFNLGVDFNIFHTRRIYFKTGLNIERFHYTGTVFETSRFYIDSSNPVQEITSLTVLKVPYNYSIDETYINVPVGMIYSLNNKKDCLLGIDGGFSGGILIAESPLKSKEKFKIRLDPYLYLGFIYTKDKTENTKYFIEPYFKFLPYALDDGRNLWSACIKVGMMLE